MISKLRPRGALPGLKPAIDASQIVLAHLTVSTNSVYCIFAKAMLFKLPTRHKLIKSLFALCWNDLKIEIWWCIVRFEACY